jgi:hypothetical protein
MNRQQKKTLPNIHKSRIRTEFEGFIRDFNPIAQARAVA